MNAIKVPPVSLGDKPKFNTAVGGDLSDTEAAGTPSSTADEACGCEFQFRVGYSNNFGINWFDVREAPFVEEETHYFPPSVSILDAESSARNLLSLERLANFELGAWDTHWWNRALVPLINLYFGYFIHENGHFLAESQTGGRAEHSFPFFPMVGYLIPRFHLYAGGNGKYYGVGDFQDIYPHLTYAVAHVNWGIDAHSVAADVAALNVARNGGNMADATVMMGASLDRLFQILLGYMQSDFSDQDEIHPNNDVSSYMFDFAHLHNTNEYYPSKSFRQTVLAGAISQALTPLALYGGYQLFKGIITGQPATDLPFFRPIPEIGVFFPTYNFELSVYGYSLRVGTLFQIAQGEHNIGGHLYARGGNGPLGTFGGAGLEVERVHFGDSPWYFDFAVDYWQQPKLENAAQRMLTRNPDRWVAQKFSSTINPGHWGGKLNIGLDVTDNMSFQFGIKAKEAGWLPARPLSGQLSGEFGLNYRY